MKTLLLCAACLFATNLLFAQNDCKFKLISDPVTGKKINAIGMSANSIFLAKKDTTVSFIYKSSTLMAVIGRKTTDVGIEIDSAELTFDRDFDKRIVCKMRGDATAENKATLKPLMQFPTFELTLTPKLIELFKNSETVRFKLMGERGTEGGVSITKGDMKKIKQALQCF